MRWSFLFNEVIRGLRRNVTMTAAMILTSAISLAMFGGGLLVVHLADKTKEIFLDRFEVRIFLTDELSQADPNCERECHEIRDSLQKHAGVLDVSYLSKAAALDDFKTRTFKNDPEMWQVSQDALPASLSVKMSDTDQYSSLITEYQLKPGVMLVSNQKETVDRLMGVFDGFRNAAFGVAIVQSLAAALLIANAVQVAAYTRRTETQIMRSVGASRWYTQLPFLLEAMVAALCGTVLAVIGLIAAVPLLFDRVIGEQKNVFGSITVSDVVLVTPWLVVLGVGFSAAISYVTLRSYVRN